MSTWRCYTVEISGGDLERFTIKREALRFARATATATREPVRLYTHTSEGSRWGECNTFHARSVVVTPSKKASKK